MSRQYTLAETVSVNLVLFDSSTKNPSSDRATRRCKLNRVQHVQCSLSCLVTPAVSHRECTASIKIKFWNQLRALMKTIIVNYIDSFYEFQSRLAFIILDIFLTLTAQRKILILSFNDIEFMSDFKHSSDLTPVLI